MYVQASKHGWKEYSPPKSFFRSEKLPTTQCPSVSMANDKPMVDTKPKSNPVSKPLGYEHGKSRKATPSPLSKPKTRRGGIKHKSNKIAKFTLLGNNTHIQIG